MIAIADCGGTSCAWRIQTSDKIMQHSTAGFNPIVSSSEAFAKELHSISSVYKNIRELHFYCAGIQSNTDQEVSMLLQQHFPDATITVATDLLAAARALCGKNPGIAAILGTGANSCIFDGHKILQNIAPLGYMLGDEGSGANLGKLLVKAYCRGQLPDSVEADLSAQFNTTPKTLIKTIYQQSRPNTFLAKFAPFTLTHAQVPEISSIIQENFDSFVTSQLLHYPDVEEYTIHFSGSVAYHFRSFIHRACKKHNLKLGIVVDSPIAGLSLFHGIV